LPNPAQGERRFKSQRPVRSSSNSHSAHSGQNTWTSS
jgi:hypothetical protein